MRRGAISYVAAALAAAAVCCGCSVTKHVPQGEYVLVKNKIEVEKETEKDNLITPKELDNYIRQRPARKLLFLNLPTWIYNSADPEKHDPGNNLLRKLGTPPVIYDSSLADLSSENMQRYMRSRGFFDAEAFNTVDTARQKAKVTYTAVPKIPYRIGRISYFFRDSFLEKVVMQDSASTLLHTGDLFDSRVLGQERERIADYLKDRGYYNFSVGNITYEADSTAGNHTVDLRMIVSQYLAGYNERGAPVFENNAIYRISEIIVNPNYDPAAAASDPDYEKRLDTLDYKGLKIVYDGRLNVRPFMLRRAIDLYPNYLYDAQEVSRTYSNIIRLGYFKTASIMFSEAEAPADDNYVTYIGSADDSTAVQTAEKYLVCTIRCTPAMKQSYSVELEGSTTSSFYGLSATLGYQNRNLFRGMELFNLSLTGAYELLKTKGSRDSYEFGITASVGFPTFLSPIRIDRLNRLYNPKTQLEVSVNAQRRPYYHRVLSSASFGYTWGNGRHSYYSIRPIDINIIKVNYISQPFLDSLKNRYLQESFKSQVVAGISGSYVYNNPVSTPKGNYLVFRTNWETAGNLIYGLANLFAKKVRGKDYYNLFGTRFAQYFRLDASISNKIALGEVTALVYRFYAGAGMTYGNSRTAQMPFDRLFYAGGINSMRGWTVRTLGPGSIPEPSHKFFASQVGDLRLEANLEFRFPIWGVFHGALFFDCGNVWFMRRRDYEDPAAIFHFDSFFRQLGLNTGLGLRVDIKYVILRLDWGIKLHDPNWPAGHRWVDKFRTRNTALNFGIGYPF